jgi:hypothetical protein
MSRNHDDHRGLTTTKSEATAVGSTSKNLNVTLTGELSMTTADSVDDLGSEGRTGLDVIEIAGVGGETIHGQTPTGNYYQGSAVKIGIGSSAGPYAETVSTSPLFTATASQLAVRSWLHSVLPQIYSESDYQAFIDICYDSVASQLGENQIVGWSSNEGYHAVDIGPSDYGYDYWGY